MDIPAENNFTPTAVPGPDRPGPRDIIAFFLGIPLAIAFLFSLVGVRLTNGMPYFDALGYMILHMLLAWWSVSAGTGVAWYLCRSWRPPAVALCVMGFVISIIPAALLFRALGDVYATWYPVFAANRADAAPSWTLEYLSHFARYSIPALPLYLAGFYGYRALTGVDWLQYPESVGTSGVSSPVSEPEELAEAEPGAPRAGLIDGVTLPHDAIIIAVKAEQHYIQVWSDQGKELVRYRFRDVAETLHGCTGGQVHRSWWANYTQVSDVRKSGRSIELTMSNGVRVPVSLAHRNTVLAALTAVDPVFDKAAG